LQAVQARRGDAAEDASPTLGPARASCQICATGKRVTKSLTSLHLAQI
jgi:hypothetical protein